MPAELKPNFKRRNTEKNVRAKVAKLVNVEETLKVLEQKEVSRNKKKNLQENEVKVEKDSDEENVSDGDYFLFLFSDNFTHHSYIVIAAGKCGRRRARR